MSKAKSARSRGRKRRISQQAFFDSNSESSESFFSSGQEVSIALNPAQTAPAPLARDTPAWSQKGNIFLGPGYFMAAPDAQQEMLRHEQVHAIHQQQAPERNSAAARNHAETIAMKGAKPDAKAFSRPAPALLGFPPQKHKPWDKVYIGHNTIIGEIKYRSIIVRIEMPYQMMGVRAVYKINKKTKKREIAQCASFVYHKGKHPRPALAKVIRRLKSAARTIAKFNRKISNKSPFRVKHLLVLNYRNPGYRTAFKSGVIIAELGSLNRDLNDMVAHETAHGIFDHHLRAGAKKVNLKQKIKPDNLSWQFIDIFEKLKNTKEVPIPKQKFVGAYRPSLTSGKKKEEAGHVMVSDTLWSGRDGHPWDDASEFFASVYAGYLQNLKLLIKSIRFYAKFDRRIYRHTSRLFRLLRAVGNKKAIRRLKKPRINEDHRNSAKALSSVMNYTDPTILIPHEVSPLLYPSRLKAPNPAFCKPSLKKTIKFKPTNHGITKKESDANLKSIGQFLLGKPKKRPKK